MTSDLNLALETGTANFIHTELGTVNSNLASHQAELNWELEIGTGNKHDQIGTRMPNWESELGTRKWNPEQVTQTETANWNWELVLDLELGTRNCKLELGTGT